MEEVDDCGELHDDMCAFFEFAGNAAVAPGKQVRTRNSPAVQEQVRVRVFKDESSALGRRVSVFREKVLRDGEVSRRPPPFLGLSKFRRRVRRFVSPAVVFSKVCLPYI